jgi:hypothetical protein
MPVILALRKLRKEYYKLEASLGYTDTSSEKKKTQ